MSCIDYDDRIRELIYAIVELAVKDVKRGPNNKRYDSARTRNYNSAVSFLKSQWFEFLTDLNGKDILSKIQGGKLNGRK